MMLGTYRNIHRIKWYPTLVTDLRRLGLTEFNFEGTYDQNLQARNAWSRQMYCSLASNWHGSLFQSTRYVLLDLEGT